MENETVTIAKSEYDKLIEDSEWLSCLEAAGVDNWERYGESSKAACKRNDKKLFRNQLLSEKPERRPKIEKETVIIAKSEYDKLIEDSGDQAAGGKNIKEREIK